jgi:hypothetical protein
MTNVSRTTGQRAPSGGDLTGKRRLQLQQDRDRREAAQKRLDEMAEQMLRDEMAANIANDDRIIDYTDPDSFDGFAATSRPNDTTVAGSGR